MPKSLPLSSRASFWIPAGSLILFSLFIVLYRIPFYGQPVNGDLTHYAVMAHEMGKGRLLYSDLWDHKPPAIHATYLLAEKWVGYGPSEFFVLGVSAAILTLVGVYGAGRSVGGWVGGLAAAFFWVLVAGDRPLEADQPNVEVFVNLFTVAMMTLALGAWNRGKMLAFGLLGAAASLYKPQALAWTMLLPAVDLMLLPGAQKSLFAKRALAFMVLPTFLAWGALLLYFDLTRPLNDVKEALLDFNAFYGHDLAKNFLRGFLLPNLFPPAFRFLTPLVLLFAWVLTRLFREDRRVFGLSLACAGAAFLSVASAGYFFEHYYQYWLPLLAMAGGWAVSRVHKEKGTWIAAGLALAVGITLAFHELPPQPKVYPAEGYQLGEMVDRVLRPGEGFFVFGGGAPAYFASRRSPPTGLISLYPAFVGPVDMIFKLRHRLMTQLDQQKPELIAFDPERQWFYGPIFSRTYRPWGHFPGADSYLLVVRKGGTLEARLEKAGAFPQK